MKKILLIVIIALVAQMTFAQNLPSYVPADGLVGYWGFNGNANDVSGNGNNGTNNGATLTADRFGNANSAFLFNGSNSIDIGNIAVSNLKTYSFWIYPTDLSGVYRTVMSKFEGDSGLASFEIGQREAQKMGFAYSTNGTNGFITNSQSSLNINTWYNYVITIDNTFIKMYLNGTLEQTITNPGVCFDNGDNIFIGATRNAVIDKPSSFFWIGKIDDIGIWNRALTQEEITQLYTTTPVPTEVAIDNQTWATKNLDVATYNDGTIIPQVTDQSEWANLTTGAWCYYNNDPANGATYGKLYNWYAVAGIYNEASKTDVSQRKKLSPTGYHVPTKNEWATLTTFLGGEAVAGSMIKEVGTTHWNSPNTQATNSSGFTGLPGGYRALNGQFSILGGFLGFWSSSKYNDFGDEACSYYTGCCGDTYFRNNYPTGAHGFSVRCIKNTLGSLSTTSVTDITTTSASSGGEITSDGGATISARGVVWNTSSNPTIDLTTKTTGGSGTGTFSSTISGLVPNTTYYVRAYATNEVGTVYGDEEIFTTLFPSELAIGTQTWTTKNLDVATYSDGTVIPQVTNPAEWANLTTGAWCYYNNDPVNGVTYGKLYNWYAVAGIWNEASKTDVTQRKKLSPTGYHVPSDAEWTILTEYLGGEWGAGGKMKEIGTTLWNSPNTDATNSSGFTGLPGGWRSVYGEGLFGGKGVYGFWWSSSSSANSISVAKTRYINYGFNYILADESYKFDGFSIRCVKNTTPNSTASAQNFCGETTVTNLVATGTDLKWYATATGGTALASDVALSTGTYYVSQTLNTTESDRTAVAVTINEAQITASANTISIGTAVTLTASTSTTGSSTLPANLQNGLVGYWPFNGNADDASGNNNNGTVNGATLTTDRFGNSNSAYNFSGGSSVSVPMTLLLHNLPVRTFSCWFNANGAQNAGRIYETTYLNGGIAMYNGNVLDAWYSNGTNECNVTNINTGNLNEWHNLVYVTDSNTGLGSIYLDGVFINSRNGLPSTSPSNWLNNFLRFGLGAQGESFIGKIDDIGIWNHALTQEEIAQLYTPVSTYLWSTGETTATINTTPTETTTYWCDVTVNGVTCRKEMTIIVKLAVISPINYCHKSTAVPLTATPTTGSTLKWYTTATSKTALATAPTPMTTPVGSKTYYVAERTAAGVESERLPIIVNINPLPSTPAAIQLTEGSNSITKVGPYIGTTTPLTLSTSAANATSFDWILPKGVLVTSAVNSSTTDADGVTTANASGNININFSGVTTGLGTLFISVKSVGNCGTSAERKIALNRVIPSTPGTISTTTSNVCFGIVGTANKVTYSIAPLAGVFAQGYAWTVPTGATIETPVANALTMTYGTEIEVSYDSSFVSGAVTVKASNGVGVSKTKTLSVLRRVPAAIASMTGPVTFCANDNATITVPNVAGVNYSWSATNGTSVTAQGTNVIASFANTSTISAYTSVTVSQNNGCGYGASKKLTLRRVSCVPAKIASQDKTSSQLFTAVAYPNPSSTNFEVTTNTDKRFGVSVYDILGRLIEERHTQEATLKIGANYQRGTYILKVIQGENQKTLQVIKK